MLSDDIETIIQNKTLQIARQETDSVAANKVGVETDPTAPSPPGSLTLHDFGALTFWFKYIGYVPYSRQSHPLNKMIPWIHIFVSAYLAFARVLAAKVDYDLNGEAERGVKR
jgi:hypothetical protein